MEASAGSPRKTKPKGPHPHKALSAVSSVARASTM